jgi:hypothetical protein
MKHLKKRRLGNFVSLVTSPGSVHENNNKMPKFCHHWMFSVTKIICCCKMMLRHKKYYGKKKPKRVPRLT